MNDILKSPAFQEFLQKRCEEYAENKLIETGIDFSKIRKPDFLMTCQNYNGIISKGNYNATIVAIENIYRNEAYKDVLERT